MSFKGFKVLEKVIENNLDLIIVCIGRDLNVREDYFEEMKRDYVKRIDYLIYYLMKRIKLLIRTIL